METVKPISTGRRRKSPKMNPTPEKMKRVNFRNAVKLLTAKLNHNFQGGDYHVVLTYKEAPEPQEAYQDLKRFLRNCRSWCQRNDITFKWIAATEYKRTRIHHHIIINAIPLEVIDKYWKYGYQYPRILDDTGNYHKLAEYLLKETEKTFRKPDSPVKQRYACSRTIITPEARTEKIAGSEIDPEPTPVDGYYIDCDSIQRYEHATTGVECRSCIMVNHDPKNKITRWPTGERIHLRSRNYKIPTEQQLVFEDTPI